MKLKVNEIYGSVLGNKILQGEGKSAGLEVSFLRLVNCNLKCFVLQGGRGVPYVSYVKGPPQLMTSAKVGDEVFAIDEATGKLTTTVIQKVITGETSDWYQFKVDKVGTFSVTGEHPFLITSKGWVCAKDIVSGDLIEHIPGSEMTSFKMKQSNPMLDPLVAAKHIRTLITSAPDLLAEKLPPTLESYME